MDKDQVMTKVFEYIDAIAGKLGVASEFVLTMLVKQQVLQGIVWGSMTIIGLILSIVLAVKLMKASWKDRGSNEVLLAAAIVSGFIVLVVVVITFVSLPHNIMKIFNPEYYALKDIMDMITGKNDD